MAKRPLIQARRWLLRLAAVCFALALLLVAMVANADTMLCIDHPPEASDAIVLLGGSPKRRPARAAELFHQGRAPLIIVTGAEDWAANQAALVGAGVPPSAILVERSASNTFQNAKLAAPLLAEREVRSALLVTDSLHTRRTLRTFQKVGPDVTFRIVGVRPGPREWKPTRSQMAKRELTECAKLAWYALRYRVSPF